MVTKISVYLEKDITIESELVRKRGHEWEEIRRQQENNF